MARLYRTISVQLRIAGFIEGCGSTTGSGCLPQERSSAENAVIIKKKLRILCYKVSKNLTNNNDRLIFLFRLIGCDNYCAENQHDTYGKTQTESFVEYKNSN